MKRPDETEQVMRKPDIEKAIKDGTAVAVLLHGRYRMASEVKVTGSHQGQPSRWGSKRPVTYYHLEVVSDPYAAEDWGLISETVLINHVTSRDLIGPWAEYKVTADRFITVEEAAAERRLEQNKKNDEARSALRDRLDAELPERLRPPIGDYFNSVTITHERLLDIITFLTEKD